MFELIPYHTSSAGRNHIYRTAARWLHERQHRLKVAQSVSLSLSDKEGSPITKPKKRKLIERQKAAFPFSYKINKKFRPRFLSLADKWQLFINCRLKLDSNYCIK